MIKNPVRVCLLGAGRVANIHASSLANHVPNGILTTIVDNNSDALNSTADQFGIQTKFSDFEDALNANNFDAVVITTPTFLHSKQTIMAAEAGKPIFLEKPMALSLEECDEIIAAVEENNVVLQMGFMRRFDPDFSAASSRIKNGEIGRPMMIKSLTHGPGLPPPWARDLKTSNGMLAEVNSHDWDCVRWLMMDDYERVFVEVSNFKGPSRGVDSENFYDNVLVNIRFKNGGLGSISGICPCEYGYDARVEIVGEKGIMQIGEMKGQSVVVCINRDEGLISPIHRTWPERFRSAYINEMNHFVNCIVEGKKPNVGPLEGRWAVAGVIAGTKSFLENRPVNLSEVLGSY